MHTEKSKEELLDELKQLQAKYDALLIKRRDDGDKVKSLFDIFPLPVSENDFSEVKDYFERLKSEGVTDFKQYFESLPNKRAEVLKLMQMVKMVDLNKAHYKLYNVTKEEYIQVIPYIFEHYEEPQINEYINQFIALAEGRQFYEIEMPPHKTISGDTKFVVSFLQVAPGFEQSLSRVFVIYIDVTERRLAEEALKESEKKLLDLVADKDRFMSILAHDLRSPFNSILGFLQLLSTDIDRFDKETIKDKIGMVYHSTCRVYELLEDILMWTKSSTGKLPFEPEKLLVNTLIENILIGFSSAAEAKKIKLFYTPVNEGYIYADVNMFNTIVRNLVSNAVKFTHQGGEVRVSVEKRDDATIFIIADNGVGVSAKLKEKLFSTSEATSTTGTANEKGGGIGLILCKDFVERHGGKIWVESQENIGSCFKFTIPHVAS